MGGGVDMSQVEPGLVCWLASSIGGYVDQWYDIPFSTYCNYPEFVEYMTNSSMFTNDYRAAFGNISVEDVPRAVAQLDHGTVHTEERIALTVLSGLMILIVVLRLYSRVVYLTGSLRADDYFIMVAVFFTLGTHVINYLYIEYAGNGKHIYDVTQHEIANALKISYALDIEINLAFFFLKISFLIFYRTLSQSKPFQRACLGLGIFITLTSFALFIASVFECHPFDVWTDPASVWMNCTNIIHRQYFQAAFSCLTDFALLCLPMSVVFKVRVKKPIERLGMLMMFGAGGLLCVIGIFRCLLTFPYLKDLDWTRYGPMFMFCYVLELQIGIIVSSLPALRAFFRQFSIPAFTSSSSGQKQKTPASTETANDSTIVSEGERKRRATFARRNLQWLKDVTHAGAMIETFTRTGTGTGTRNTRRTWRSLGSFSKSGNDTHRSTTAQTRDFYHEEGRLEGGELSPIRIEVTAEKSSSPSPQFATRMCREDMENGLSRVHTSESEDSVESMVIDNGRRPSASSIGRRSGDMNDRASSSVHGSNINIAEVMNRSASPGGHRESHLASINESEIAFSGLAPRPPPRTFTR